jgi:hypothetical protein
MNAPDPASTAPDSVSREEFLSALFAGMVIQQTNMALMLLGRVPHPATGQTEQDLDGARLMIDQLEMVEAKTRGNLSEPESRLLKQNLAALHMAFVEAVEQPSGAPATASPAPAEAVPPAAPEAATASEEESKKRFSKKY